jgi:transcriptional regulator with XRE-family HTH domain
MNTIEQRFGERVRELRLALGLSQEELAFRSGMHRTYLSGIERGTRNPSLKNISKIAEAIGITLSELFLFSAKSEKENKSY